MMEIDNLITNKMLSNKLYILPPPLNSEAITEPLYIKLREVLFFEIFKIISSQKR